MNRCAQTREGRLSRAVMRPPVRASVLVVFAWACAGCDEVPVIPEEWRFGESEVIWQQNDRDIRGVFIVEAMGGRTFAFINAVGTDGQPAIWRSERTSTGWTPVEVLIRPLGATQERVEWSLSSPSPAVFTLVTRAEGTFVAVRPYEGMRWSDPRAVTTLQEAVGMVRADLGVAFKNGQRRVHVLYTARGGNCPDGVQLRHRASRDLVSWGETWDIVANPCSVRSLSLAVDPSAVGPIMALWTGSVTGGNRDTQDVFVTRAPNAAMPEFDAPSTLQLQGNRGVQVVATSGGRFMAAWLRSISLETDSPAQRAVFAAYDPQAGWARSDAVWFNSSTAPFLASVGPSGAYVFSTENETDAARLVVRRWASERQPVASFSPVRRPLGVPSWLRLEPAGDGSLHAVWVESPRETGVQRVHWVAGVRVNNSDAGR